MEFRPFWDLLEHLGIVLPNASRTRENQREKQENTAPTASRKSSRRQQRPLSTIFVSSRPLDAADVLEQINADRREEVDLDLLEQFSPLPEASDLQKRSAAASNSPLETNSERFWVPPGKKVKVAGYEIPGMVYVGENLSAINNVRASETSLINPQLKVKRDQPDLQGKLMPYSTSYSQMPPACRAAYLNWLSTGRCQPNIHVGYVWLFFMVWNGGFFMTSCMQICKPMRPNSKS